MNAFLYNDASAFVCVCVWVDLPLLITSSVTDTVLVLNEWHLLIQPSKFQLFAAAHNHVITLCDFPSQFPTSKISGEASREGCRSKSVGKPARKIVSRSGESSPIHPCSCICSLYHPPPTHRTTRETYQSYFLVGFPIGFALWETGREGLETCGSAWGEH